MGAGSSLPLAALLRLPLEDRVGLSGLGRPRVGRDPLPVVLDTAPPQLFLGGKLSVEVRCCLPCALWCPGSCRRLGEGRGREVICGHSAATAPTRVSPCPGPPAVAVVWIQVPTTPAPSYPTAKDLPSQSHMGLWAPSVHVGQACPLTHTWLRATVGYKGLHPGTP